MSSFKTCTQVTPECPIAATTYGYRPNLAANVLFLVIFALCTIGQLILGIRYRLRAFLGAATIGCLLEVLGYVGRLLMNANPWDQSGFELQIITIIIAPSFLAAAVYLTLKHLVLSLGKEHSRLAPKYYPRIFIGCDLISIITQAAGGGLAASHQANLINIGNDLIIAGIAFQVATMFLCWLLAIDFVVRLQKSDPGLLKSQSAGFLFYLAASATAFLTIFIRCVYRIPEMSGGWGSELQRNEPEFLVLDGAMIAIATILMTIAHPGIFFPAISSRHKAEDYSREKTQEGDESSS